MHIEYTKPTRAPEGVTFQHLTPGWYEGGQTGLLYYFFKSPEGKPHLVRCHDDKECTRYSERSGTFIRVRVKVVVDGNRP